MDYRTEAPPILKDFLIYHETVKGHSRKTVDEYFLDLRTFFRFMVIHKDKKDNFDDLDTIDISKVDIDFIKSISLSDVYDYLSFLSRDRLKNQNSRNPEYGLSSSSRARKVSTIRSFYKYLTVKAHLLDENPIQDLDSPKIKKSLPRYLTLDESISLLNSVKGPNKERDFCILVLFLNCGMRISELVGLNISDIRGDSIRILGKGNKERIVYINDACASSLADYLLIRKTKASIDTRALFLSNQNQRISKSTVHSLVKKYLSEAGLDSSKYSAHKLRHTAATLMLQNGVGVRTLQELLGHENLNTTQIYTHVDNENLKAAAQASPLKNIKPNKK